MFCGLVLNPFVVIPQESSVPIGSAEPVNETADPIEKTVAKLSMKLEEQEVQIHKGDLAANLLTVQNNTNKAVNYYVDINLPDRWKSFGLSRYFTVEPNATMVIPIRILPMNLEGSTQFFIGVNLIEETGDAIISDFFYIKSFKVVDWDVSVDPGNRIYLKNGETTKKFDVSVSNQGNYQQDLIMRLKGQRENLIMKDATGQEITSPKYAYALDASEDTTFNYEIEVTNDRRNFKTVSIQDFKPNLDNAEKSYSLYVNTSEAQASGNNLQKKGHKIDFIKLANEKRANQFSGPVLPVIAEANIQNLLGENPFMNLMLRGFTRFDDGSNLVYFGQVNYSSNFYSQRYLENAAWYAGYFNKNYTAEVGNVAGGTIGLPASGRGAKGSYRVYKDHWVGAYYLRNPTLFNETTRETFGVFYKYEGKKRLRGSLGLARGNDFLRNRNTNIINGRLSYRLAKSHNLSIIGAFSNRNVLDTNQATVSRQGFLVGANYSGRFLNGKLTSNVAGRYQNATFGLTDNERRILNTRIQYRLSDVSALMINSTVNQNTYQLNRLNSNELTTNFFMYNMLAYNRNTKYGSVQPYVYAQSSEVLRRRINSFGLGSRYSNYIFNKNILWASNIYGGYNKAYFIPDLPLYFNFAANSMLRIRTFTGMVGYYYGATSAPALISALNTGITPEYVRFSINHQYLFKNRHFVLQNSAAINYQNQVRNSRLNYFPELFYFTNSGWRFSINANLSYNYRRSRAGFSAIGTPTTVSEERTSSAGNARFGASIRKEFGVPIPFTEKKNFTKTFIAFYDQNGNSVKDKDEPSLENVVIQIGQQELITNREGVARLLYATGGTYAYSAFSLEELKDWFPNISDSLSIVSEGKEFVPFVKGVKLYGKIVIDREKMSVNADKAIDLTNIKVTASGSENHYSLTDFDGNFEFYLPNGSYTVSIDEAILGSKYELAKNNILVYLKQGVEGVFITFYIIERKRKIVRKKFGKEGVQTFGESNNPDTTKTGMKLDDIIPKGDQDFKGDDTENNTDNNKGQNPDESDIPTNKSDNNQNNDNDDQDPVDPKDIPNRNIANDDYTPPIEDIVDMTNIDPEKVSYFIDLGEFEESVPTNIFNMLIKMGFSSGQAGENSLRFTSDKFKNEADADAFKQEAIQVGFSNPEPKMRGDYDGNEISADKAREMYELGLQQQKN